MAYSRVRGTGQSTEPIRFGPMTQQQKKQRKYDKELRIKEAKHWREATKEFIEHVLIYREKGGRDAILNSKIKAYLQSLNIDYNEHIINQNGRTLGQGFWMNNAPTTQDTKQKTFYDLVREKEAEKQIEREQKGEEKSEVRIFKRPRNL